MKKYRKKRYRNEIRVNSNRKRMISLAMVWVLCLMLLPASAFAAEDSGAAIGTGGLCAHHTEHNDTCGYVEGIAESPCTHEHSEDCYTKVTSCTHEHSSDCYPASDSSIPEDGTTSSEGESVGDTTPSDDKSVEDTTPSDDESGKNATLPEAAEPTACSHVCSVESGCIKQELHCKHEHNEECGYAPAVEGQPCTYVCTLCGMTEITAWSFVDTLEVINPENGVLALSASEDSPVLYDEIVALLPTEITATTQDGTETITLGRWTCPDYPETGAYTGSYKFTAALPDGYALAADAPALTVTVELGGVVMLADDGDHRHPICGASCTHVSQWTKHNEDVTFASALTVLKDNNTNTFQLYANGKEVDKVGNYYNLAAGSYYLADNITLDNPIWVQGVKVNLCLNGHTITMRGNFNVFEISSGTGEVGNTILNLTDCSDGKGTIKHDANTSGTGYGVWLKEGSFNMYGGTITGNDCGVFIFYASNDEPTQWFTMYGGSITENHSKGGAGGAGVRFCEGRMTLNGSPVIKNNTAMGKTSNLWLNSGNMVIMYYDGLTEGADIGVSTDQTPTSGNPVDITKCEADYYRNYFHPDDTNYEIGVSEGSYNNMTVYTVQLTTKTGSETPHTHSWSYICLSADTIEANCTNRDTKCDTPTATVTIKAPENTTYDGKEKGATLLESEKWKQVSADDITITYQKYINGSYVNISGTPTLVGRYKASITVGEGENTATAYVNYEITDSSTPTPGEKTDPQYTDPTAKPGLTYNGRAHILINPGHVAGGIMQYRLDGGTYSTTLPTAINAGTYTIYYMVKGDRDHNDTAEQSITVTIGKAALTGTPTFTPVTEAGKTIGDVTLTAPTRWPKGTFSWRNGEDVLDNTTPITQGTPYRWLFIPDDKNYQSIGGDLVLWKDTSGGSSSNPGGGSSGGGSGSSTGGGSSSGGSSSSTGDGSSDTGNSNNGSSNTNIPPTPVTVPVSGDEKTIQVDAVVSGTTATIKNVDLPKLDTVIEDTAKNGVVTIDFSVLKKVDTVKLPSNVVKQLAEAVNDPDNDAKNLEIVLTNGTSVKLDAKVLDEKNVQANGADITLSIKRITDSSLNIKQKLTVGNRPALNINVTLGGKPISNMNGRVTVSASYELKPGEHASGIIVSYVDANGNRQLCETSYDPVKKLVSWKTGPLSPSSIYMIGYDESRVKPGTGSYVTYTVQKGSTLSMIARKYGCTVAEILAANSGLIRNPNRIYVGWQLKIPQD